MSERLVVNVEEQIAKRLYDKGFPVEARRAVTRAQSLDSATPLNDLQTSRLVAVTRQEQLEQAKSAATAAWANLRADRDVFLAASDWTQLPDVSAKKQKAWAEYRKKLRELPAKTKDPAKVTWPTPPE